MCLCIDRKYLGLLFALRVKSLMCQNGPAVRLALFTIALAGYRNCEFLSLNFSLSVWNMGETMKRNKEERLLAVVFPLFLGTILSVLLHVLILST